MASVELRQKGGTATLTLTHAGRRNALNRSMWIALREHLAALAHAPDLRVIVIQGEGEHFAGGADISEFPELRGTEAQVRAYHEDVIAPALASIAAAPVPTLASIRGVCVGGGLEIAAQCDLRLCADDARLGVPIARLGFPMAPDELGALLQLVGRATALELLLEGRLLDASEAYHKGLVTRVVPAADLPRETEATAARLAGGAPLAARLNKEMVRRLTAAAPALSELERVHAFAYASSADHQEGVRAFLEKREPRFRGH